MRALCPVQYSRFAEHLKRPTCLQKSVTRLAALLFGLNIAYAGQQTDGLLQIEPGRAIFLNRPYEQVCEQALFVTPGDIARYFFIPAFKDPEIVASVYTSPRKDGSMSADYWVTVTRPLHRIAQFSDTRPFPNAKTIKVERHDAPISASAAQAIHRVWLTMLTKARSRTRLDMELDSDSMLFYATADTGKTLRAERYGRDENVFALIKIGELLIDYAHASVRERAPLAHTIEARASALYGRVR